jgi:uncharacterized FlaG/YvyC family protein
MDVAALHSGARLASLPPRSLTPKCLAQTLDVKAQKPAEPQSVSHSESPDRESLNKEIGFANSVAALFDKKVSFSYDDRIKQVVVKVIQEGTEEVIRQFPPEEMINLRLWLKANFQGMILNQAG